MSSQHFAVETEDAAELNFGDDFRGETCLSNAEVSIVLNKQKKEYEQQQKELTDVFKKTYSYVQRFSGVRDPDANQASISELRDTLINLSFPREGEDGKSADARLDEFEIACLTNLNPEEAEEANTLIPSLSSRFRDDEIEEILSIISRTTARMFS